MRYGFINNFSQLLAADLAAGATEMTLDGGGALLDNASADLVYALTLDDGEGTTEIVHVTAATTNTLTIERAQEGTADSLWPVGSTVEMRVTAGSLTQMLMTAPGGNARGQDAIEWQTWRNTSTEVAAGWDSIAIGSATQTAAYGDLAIGTGVRIGASDGSGNTAIGYWMEASDLDLRRGSVIIGSTNMPGGYLEAIVWLGYNFMYGSGNAQTVEDGVIIGYRNNISNDSGAYLTAVGRSNYTAKGIELTAIGYNNGIENTERGVALGANNYLGTSLSSPAIMAPLCVGVDSRAETDYMTSIGALSRTSLTGCRRIQGLSFTPASIVDTSTRLTVDPPAHYTRSGDQVTLTTDQIDLLTAGDNFIFTLPAGLFLFVDEIDIIVTASNTAGGSPAINVGTDAGTPSDLLAAKAISVTDVGSRQKETPLSDAGFNTLRVAVSTAGTGTAYGVKVVFKGYALEI